MIPNEDDAAKPTRHESSQGLCQESTGLDESLESVKGDIKNKDKLEITKQSHDIGFGDDAIESIRSRVSKAERSDVATEISVGVVAVLAGITITAISYNAASPGGKFVVWWGLIVWGLYKIVKNI